MVAAAVPDMDKKDLAKELAKWVRGGLSIERCDDDTVRRYLGDIMPSPQGGA